MRKSMLKSEIERKEEQGYSVESYVNGLNAPTTKSSNLYKALSAAKEKSSDVIYVVGVHRRNGPDGWEMAVMTK